MKYHCGGVQRKGGIGNDAGIVPALSGVVVHDKRYFIISDKRWKHKCKIQEEALDRRENTAIIEESRRRGGPFLNRKLNKLLQPSFRLYFACLILFALLSAAFCWQLALVIDHKR